MHRNSTGRTNTYNVCVRALAYANVQTRPNAKNSRRICIFNESIEHFVFHFIILHRHSDIEVQNVRFSLLFCIHFGPFLLCPCSQHISMLSHPNNDNSYKWKISSESPNKSIQLIPLNLNFRTVFKSSEKMSFAVE